VNLHLISRLGIGAFVVGLMLVLTTCLPQAAGTGGIHIRSLLPWIGLSVGGLVVSLVCNTIMALRDD
jgi:hypothetical protein